MDGISKRLERGIVAVSERAARRPWLWCGLSVAVCLLAGLYAARTLEYRPQRNDLLSPHKPCQQRWQQYLDRFGADEDIVVVAAGTDRRRQTAAIDAVAARLQQHPEVFDRILYVIDLRPLQDRLLWYASVEQLEGLQQQLQGMQPLTDAAGAWAWRSLTLAAVLEQAIGVSSRPQVSPREAALLATAEELLGRAALYLLDPQGDTPLWPLAEGDEWTRQQPSADPLPDASWRAALHTPQHLITPDGALALLLCRPRAAETAPQEIPATIRMIRHILQEVQADYPDVELGLTGLPVLESDEMAQADADSRRAALLALMGIAVLYAVAYRGLRDPLLTLVPLVAGVVDALGWAALTVGHLNILTSAFAVMMVGVGDYGVLWVTRYDLARRGGATTQAAIREAAAHAGTSIAAAALTTSLGFFALMAVDFAAVAELGWIAGCGVLLCAANCWVMMPALVVLSERRRCQTVGSTPSSDAASAAPGRAWPPNGRVPGPPGWPGWSKWAGWLGWLGWSGWLRWKSLAVGSGLLAAAALVLGGIPRAGYDHNLLHLQAAELPSVQWEQRLMTHAAGTTWDALSLAGSPQEARRLRAAYEALPEVGQVVEVASLLPTDVERKRPLLEAIHRQLQHLPPRLPPDGASSEPQRLMSLCRQWEVAFPSVAAPLLCDLLERTPHAAERLRALDQHLRQQLYQSLWQLRQGSRPEPITTEDIPKPLRERYIGSDGTFLVRAYARDDLWDYQALERFLLAVTQVDPQATGKTFRTYEGLRQMHRGFVWASVYAFVAVGVLVWLDLRRPGLWLAAFVPVACGLLLTWGSMGWCGLSWNPANIVALPLIVGVGLDHGVHVLHDYVTHRRSGRWRIHPATVRGIVVAGLTTILGFGTLALSQHRGMASLGVVLSLGVGWCLIVAILLLPNILRQMAFTGPRVLTGQWWVVWWRRFRVQRRGSSVA